MQTKMQLVRVWHHIMIVKMMKMADRGDIQCNQLAWCGRN